MRLLTGSRASPSRRAMSSSHPLAATNGASSKSMTGAQALKIVLIKR